MEKKRAFLYCRTALPNMDELEMQKTYLIDYARKQELTINGIVSESGIGLDYSRAGLREIMAAAEDGEVDVLLVNNLSRLGRDNGKNDALLRWLKEYDVSVVCADGTVPQTFSEMFDKLVKGCHSSHAKTS